MEQKLQEVLDMLNKRLGTEYAYSITANRSFNDSQVSLVIYDNGTAVAKITPAASPAMRDDDYIALFVKAMSKKILELAGPVEKPQATKVTIEDVEAAVVSEEYLKLGTKMTACILTLKNGHEVVGLAGCVDASKYDINIGSKFAREKAIDEVWSLLGYALQEELYMKGISCKS